MNASKLIIDIDRLIVRHSIRIYLVNKNHSFCFVRTDNLFLSPPYESEMVLIMLGNKCEDNGAEVFRPRCSQLAERPV